MSEEIVNRVANSGLITIDLSDHAPKENILLFDVKFLLFEGIILKEKGFRSSLKEFDYFFGGLFWNKRRSLSKYLIKKY